MNGLDCVWVIGFRGAGEVDLQCEKTQQAGENLQCCCEAGYSKSRTAKIDCKVFCIAFYLHCAY